MTSGGLVTAGAKTTALGRHQQQNEHVGSPCEVHKAILQN